MQFKYYIKRILILAIFLATFWLLDDFSFYITNKNCSLNSNQTLIFSDVHIFGDYTGTWAVKLESERYMRKLFKYIPETGTKIHLGDTLHEGFFNYTNRERFKKYVNLFQDIFGSNILQLVGNHDIGNNPTESSLQNYVEFIGELNYIYDNFCFLNTMFFLNQTFVETLPENCTCFLHYPEFDRTILNTKCTHYFVGHVHLFKEDFLMKETILPTFNPFQTDYQTGYLLTDFQNYKLCSGINYLFVPFFTSLNLSLLYFILQKKEYYFYYECLYTIDFQYFSVEYLVIIFNSTLFLVSYFTNINEIYAIWFYLYLMLMSFFIIDNSERITITLIVTFLIVISFVITIVFPLGIFITFLKTGSWRVQEY